MQQGDPQSVITEFGKAVEDLLLTLSFTKIGLDRLLDWIAEQPRSPENPDPRVFIGPDPPGEPSSLEHGSWRFSQIIVACDPSDDVRTLLAQQWLVTTYALWEEEYRSRIAKALGGRKRRLLIPVFGDMRLMRNDIIHNRSIASTNRTARCEMLTWFSEGGKYASPLTT